MKLPSQTPAIDRIKSTEAVVSLGSLTPSGFGILSKLPLDAFLPWVRP